MEDDILTEQEEEHIRQLRTPPLSMVALTAFPMARAGPSSLEPAAFTFERRLGINPFVTINNISGKRAWVILAPAPITSVGSIGLEKVGNIAFSTQGEYKCQQFLLANNKSDDYELDNSQIYYSAFFEMDGKWKTPFKNRMINTRKYNINLLERHVVDSIDSDQVPG